MRRGARGSGVTVDPQRVRQARVQAGLSLRAVAGEEVSPTFIHFVERGISRPSRPVLALIARRTGQPISYFMAQPSEIPQQAPDLAAELARLADRARNLGTTSQMATVEREAMKLIELTLRQAAQLIKAIERNGIKATKRH